MHRSIFSTAITIAAPAVFLLAACSDQRAPTDVSRSTTQDVALSREVIGPGHTAGIVAHDACDPETFNATKFGPGTCVKEGPTTFQEFFAEVVANHAAKGWHLTPETATAQFGSDLLGNNVGGEVHTFTPVRAFGGSIIPELNEAIGNPVVAEECKNLDDDDKVASGSQYRIEAEELAAAVDGDGIARVQCCIHPWMRTEIHLHGAAN